MGVYRCEMGVNLTGQYGILALLAYDNVQCVQISHKFINFAGFLSLLKPLTLSFRIHLLSSWLHPLTYRLFLILPFWSHLDFRVLDPFSAFLESTWVRESSFPPT